MAMFKTGEMVLRDKNNSGICSYNIFSEFYAFNGCGLFAV